MNCRLWWWPRSFSTPPLSTVYRLSSLSAHLSHDGQGGSGDGTEEEGPGSVWARESLVHTVKRDTLWLLCPTLTHCHAYMDTHTHTPLHADSWSIDCSVYVHHCSMGATKRGFQSHSVESLLAIRLPPSPCALFMCSYDDPAPLLQLRRLETTAEWLAAQESTYTPKHEDKHAYSTYKIWYSHIVSL